MVVIWWGLIKTIVFNYYLYAQPLFLIYHSPTKPNIEPPERFLRRFEKDNVTNAFFKYVNCNWCFRLRSHVMCSRGLVSKPQGETG